MYDALTLSALLRWFMCPASHDGEARPDYIARRAVAKTIAQHSTEIAPALTLYITLHDTTIWF